MSTRFERLNAVITEKMHDLKLNPALYRSKMEALGLLVASYTNNDPVFIADVAAFALENANAHVMARLLFLYSKGQLPKNIMDVINQEFQESNKPTKMVKIEVMVKVPEEMAAEKAATLLSRVIDNGFEEAVESEEDFDDPDIALVNKLTVVETKVVHPNEPNQV